MKKKMMKIFSKLTVLVLLVAMLIPYTSIPKVEAEESCQNGEWEYHTNYYFFAQAEHPRTWAYYLSTDDKTQAFSTDDTTANTYYTSFLYNFPSDGTEMEITSAGFVNLDMDGNKSQINSTSEWSVKGFYDVMLKMADSDDAYDYANPSSIYKEYSQLADTGNKGTSSSDSIVTYLIHGPWGFVGTGDSSGLSSADIVLNDKESLISMESYDNSNNTNASDDKVINELTKASVLPDQNTISDINIGIAHGDLDTNEGAIETIESAIEDFNRDKGEKLKGGIYRATKNGEKTGDVVLKLYIRRSYETDDFFTFNHIRKQTGGLYMATDLNTQEEVDALSTTEKLYFPEIDNACDTGRDDCNEYAYVTLGQGSDNKASNPTAIKLGNEDPEYWFLAPSLFQISYKVCNTGGTGENQVALTYNANEPSDATEEATGIPEKQVQDKGTEFTISEKEPSLKGYTFKNWNLSEKCDSTSYEAGADLGTLENDTPLFACWGATGSTNNGKTGVLTYTGLFTGIIALAGGSYYLIKKKSLFKKI